MKHSDFLNRLNEARKKQAERQEELIKAGNPYIVYFRGVSESGRQVFPNEEDCNARIKELEKAGYLVTRIQ